jgi:hypothetical protein
VTDDEGHIVKSGRFRIDSEGISEFMEGLEEAQIAMEAGYCWQSIYARALYEVKQVMLLIILISILI